MMNSEKVTIINTVDLIMVEIGFSKNHDTVDLVFVSFAEADVVALEEMGIRDDQRGTGGWKHWEGVPIVSKQII